MAKSLLTVKRKKPRVTRNEAYTVNVKYLGEEPAFKEPLSDIELAKALSWYNYMCDLNDAREYISDHLKLNNRKEDLKTFRRVPDQAISTTLAWVVRMLGRGYSLPGDIKTFVDTRLPEVLSKAKREEPMESKVIAFRPSIQDRIREKQSDIIGDIEELIDKVEPFSLYEWLKGKEIPATYAGPIAAKYAHIVEELIEASEGSDPQLKEGYRYMTRKQLKERIEFYQTIVSDAERYGNVAKKTKAPRKPRAVSMEKRLKNFKFQKEDNTFKIASINPEKIIGAQELWTFNTKYKVVTVFRALDRGGLQIERSNIKGYDEKNSFSKGCGRQAEKVVDKVQNGGKIVLKKLIDELKTGKPLQFRINENTILMKVVT